MAQTFGVVHVLISSETTKHRLPRSKPTNAWRPFLPVRASASISPAIALQPKRVVSVPGIRVG